MKKGQRPSKHTRRVKTKRGRKTVVVNPKIRKKVKVSRRRRPSKSAIHSSKPAKPFSIADASPAEIERLIFQQEEMNLENELAEIREMEKELDKINSAQIAAQRKEREAARKSAEADLKELQEQEMYENQKRMSTKQAKKKLGEFDRLMSQLERKRKDNTKIDFVEQIFGGSGKNMNEKLEDLERFAKQSGDPELIARADQARGDFETFIYGPQQREMMRDLEERERLGTLTRQEKIGLEMIRMPEVTKSTTKFVTTLPENLPSGFQDWNEFKKKNPDVILQPPTPAEAQKSIQDQIKAQEQLVKSFENRDKILRDEEKKARQLQHGLREQILQDLKGKRKEIAQERGVSLRYLNQLSDRKKQLREQLNAER